MVLSTTLRPRCIASLSFTFLLLLGFATHVQAQVSLTASDGATNDRFGFSVSQSGTLGLVGAYAKSSNTSANIGAAYLYRGLDTATGTVPQNVKLTATDGVGSDNFGFSVSQSGTTGLVGAFGKNSFQGAAYLFRGLDTATGTVTQNAKLTASDGAANDRFGAYVSHSGTIGLVGAYGKNSNQGAAYLFQGLDTANGSVTQNVKLTASDGVTNDFFGESVSQSGTFGLVGAPGKNSRQGAAYLFRGLDTASGTVIQDVKLTASDAENNDAFGSSVSQSGTMGLVGADGKNSFQGAAYLFRGLDAATGTVTEIVKLTASDGAANDSFGRSVSLSGDQFTVGAYGKNSATGKAYTGTVSSVTILDLGSTSKTIDGISFVSQDNWIVGQNTSANQVTLNAGNTANVTASGKIVYVGQNAGSNNNTLVISGTLTASQVTIGATGNSGNVLQVNTGGAVAAGAITVNTGGTLAGTGTVTGTTTVANNGTIRGGTGTSTGTLTTGNVTVQSGGKIFMNLAASGTSIQLALGANTLDLKTGSILKLDDVTGYSATLGATYTIAQLTNGTTLLLDGLTKADGFQFGKYDITNGNTGPVQIDVSSLPALGAGTGLVLTRSGNNLVLSFVPVPEPALLFSLAAGVLGVGALVRKKFFTPANAA